MDEPKPKVRARSWGLVLCLVGLDYFSTLAYLPSLAVRAAGPIAPLAAGGVALATLFFALPVYLYVVGRSPFGRGAVGLLEKLLHGWAGKLFILTILAFVATDYVVTRSLSIADAAEHVLGNPYVRAEMQVWPDSMLHPRQWLSFPLWRRMVEDADPHVVASLVLTLAVFVLLSFWRWSDTKTFLRLSVLIVIGYLALNAIVIVSGLIYITGVGKDLLDAWQRLATDREVLGAEASFSQPTFLHLLSKSLAAFPHLALGLSGFELSMAVAPLVKGSANDADSNPKGRVRNVRKLLTAAALLMTPFLVGSVFIVTLLVGADQLEPGATAEHRALAYLAHGGIMSNGASAANLCFLFGPVFGTVYDVFSVAILCFSGVSVAIALADYVPTYLIRFGLEFNWARRIGLNLHLGDVLILAIILIFHASVNRLQWVYATSVLVLLASASLAALLDVRRRLSGNWRRRVASIPFLFPLAFFVTLAGSTIFISLAGLEIAAAFIIGMFATSMFSRYLRSTELRFSGFTFVDDESRLRWSQLCAMDFQVLIPHRPGLHSRREKEIEVRKLHRISDSTPIVFVEAHVDDPSEFTQSPVMRIFTDEGIEIIELNGCASTAHTLAAIGLEWSKVGKPPEIHFGWSDESPLAANANFFLFGEGNIPWMVRELTRKAEPDVSLRPRIVIG